jgi:dipeptidase D
MKPASYPNDPAHLWQHFYALSQIPRPSGQEQAVRQYVIEQAESQGCRWRLDDFGNLVVYVPASAGLEAAPVVVIQNHLDMVTVKNDASSTTFPVILCNCWCVMVGCMQTGQPWELIMGWGVLRLSPC